MIILRNASQVVTVATGAAPYKAGLAMREIGVVTNANVCIEGETFAAVLPSNASVPAASDDDDIVVDCAGKVVLPGFVDSHTHAAFAGSRAGEFAMRLEGKSYREIANAGGGIASTVRAVRNASQRNLESLLETRLQKILRHGTTTIEIKSGYGLDMPNEIKLLSAIRELQRREIVEIHPTFLGAHAVPPEFEGKRREYVALIINEMLPAVARTNLAEFCDVFCDDGFFTNEETVEILTAAKSLGMKPKIHADELACTGGAEVAARLGALSADHLLRASKAGITAMKRAGVVATLLPGTAYTLGMEYAPARNMIDEGLVLALATDFNPGTSPVFTMQMILSLACTQMNMTVEEAITAATINGAAAIGKAGALGSIEPGKQADAVVFDVPDYRDIAYNFGANAVHTVVKRGNVACTIL